MRRMLAVIFAWVFLFPLTVQGQDWTAEQRELWDWEVACWDAKDIDSNMACFHEDFVGWGADSHVPTNRADRRITHARGFETSDQVYLFLKPLAIKIHGNTAVLIYMATYTQRDKVTGEETTYVEQWTDVALRENGRWAWIADHGTVLDDEEG